MSKHNSGRGGQSSGNTQNHGQNDHRRISGEISVTGKVEANLPPKFLQEFETSNGHTKTREDKRYIVEVITLSFAALVVIFAFIQSCASIKSANNAQASADAANASVKLLKDQFVLDQRPYVAVTGIGFASGEGGIFVRNPPAIGKPLIVDIHFRNLGKSPALNTAVIRFLAFGPNVKSRIAAQRIFPVLDHRSTLFPLPQDLITTAVSINDPERNQSPDINPSELVNWDGSLPIAVFGDFFYEDSFGNRYCTPFAERMVNLHNWQDITGFDPGSCQEYENKK